MAWLIHSMWSSVNKVRPYVASLCGQSEDNERLHFAKHGHSQGDTELSSIRQRTVEGDDNETGYGAEGEFGKERISEWQAGWNVTNAIQGMFIVSLPYAVLHGGYWGVFALVFVSYICCHTGKILVHCLYEPNEKGEMIRVRNSYVAIADICLGERWGGKVVNIAQIIELLMTCILYVVLCGDLMIGSFPDGPVDQRSWMMISAMFLLPCAFLRHLHAVSLLSFWCTVAHIIINVVVLGYCLTRAGDWLWGKVQFRVDIHMFPVTLGIVVFSYTSQIFLPTLEGNMQNKSRFECMLNWSHVAAAIFKGLFAYMGFLTWGEQTQEVITNNLPTQGFKVIVNLTLVLKALLSYPLPYFAAIGLLESAFFEPPPNVVKKAEEEIQREMEREASDFAELREGDPEPVDPAQFPPPIPEGAPKENWTFGKSRFPSCIAMDGDLRIWAVALRVLLVIFITLMAMSIPHFALLMGLIGSFTGTMLSFVWPCYFHMKLKWQQMEWYSISWEVFIMFLGISCGICGFYNSASALVEAYHIPLPYVKPHPQA